MQRTIKIDHVLTHCGTQKIRLTGKARARCIKAGFSRQVAKSDNNRPCGLQRPPRLNTVVLRECMGAGGFSGRAESQVSYYRKNGKKCAAPKDRVRFVHWRQVTLVQMRVVRPIPSDTKIDTCQEMCRGYLPQTHATILSRRRRPLPRSAF